MRTAVAALVLIGTCAAPAAAQAGRFYAGAVAGVDSGSRGPIGSGSFPTAGALVGTRIGGGWSAELEVERGFRTEERPGRSLYVSEKADLGWSGLAVWRSRQPGRVNGAVFGGITSRRFKARLPNQVEQTITGKGLTGGGMLLIRIAGPFTLAPEFRYTAGLITDESTYSVSRVAVRALWNF